ncbi:hypothetical protein BC939DRAFT_434741 [Gamsiella multidivaricata]|uniref:uncharacterized protein n=1 Tax=Gamsiella multidivaricata TaxID=101098 RepID=UPI00222014C5|nr:uncharacterized protein BC939DRAFT_434741 [Gamsiella multidivaricata]KAG0370428.1 hypothetical protein BGZ54_006321 [Gamsiella multidivaricata]KAI7832180.1 hypothetical protein BC939DRAFT_434741 [Gamsiella multidivaricata]
MGNFWSSSEEREQQQAEERARRDILLSQARRRQQQAEERERLDALSSQALRRQQQGEERERQDVLLRQLLLKQRQPPSLNQQPAASQYSSIWGVERPFDQEHEDESAEYFRCKSGYEHEDDWRKLRKASRTQQSSTSVGRRKRGRKGRGDLYEDDYHAGHSKKEIQEMCQERQAVFEAQCLKASHVDRRENEQRRGRNVK